MLLLSTDTSTAQSNLTFECMLGWSLKQPRKGKKLRHYWSSSKEQLGLKIQQMLTRQLTYKKHWCHCKCNKLSYWQKSNVFLLLSLDIIPSEQWAILNLPVLVLARYIKGSKQSQIISKGFPQQQISSHEESKSVSEVNRMSRQWLYFSNAVFHSPPFSLGPLQKPFWYCRELIFAIIWEERMGDIRKL